jgi:hypothetical protein
MRARSIRLLRVHPPLVYLADAFQTIPLAFLEFSHLSFLTATFFK